VRVVGHRDVPGKPALYATTKEFLDYFNLKSLNELPTLAEIRDLESINRELELQDPDKLSDEQDKAAEPSTENDTEDSQALQDVEQPGSADQIETESVTEAPETAPLAEVEAKAETAVETESELEVETEADTEVEAEAAIEQSDETTNSAEHPESAEVLLSEEATSDQQVETETQLTESEEARQPTEQPESEPEGATPQEERTPLKTEIDE
jgi:segregation and condensation protein B